MLKITINNDMIYDLPYNVCVNGKLLEKTKQSNDDASFYLFKDDRADVFSVEITLKDPWEKLSTQKLIFSPGMFIENVNDNLPLSVNYQAVIVNDGDIDLELKLSEMTSCDKKSTRCWKTVRITQLIFKALLILAFGVTLILFAIYMYNSSIERAQFFRPYITDTEYADFMTHRKIDLTIFLFLLYVIIPFGVSNLYELIKDIRGYSKIELFTDNNIIINNDIGRIISYDVYADGHQLPNIICDKSHSMFNYMLTYKKADITVKTVNPWDRHPWLLFMSLSIFVSIKPFEILPICLEFKTKMQNDGSEKLNINLSECIGTSIKSIRFWLAAVITKSFILLSLITSFYIYLRFTQNENFNISFALDIFLAIVAAVSIILRIKDVLKFRSEILKYAKT